MTLSTAPTSGQIAQYAPLANSVSRKFNNRPSLRSVARELVATALAKLQPALLLGDDSLLVAWPRADEPPGEPAFIAVEDLLMLRFVQNTTLNLVDQYDYAVRQRDAATPERLALTIGELERLINDWGPVLLRAYQCALVDYWNHTDATGESRWLWLARHLRDHARGLTRRMAEQKRLNVDESATLLDVINDEALPGTSSLLLQIDHLANPNLSTPEVTSQLVVTRAVQGAEHPVVLLYNPLSTLEAFPSLASLAEHQTGLIGAELTGSAADFSLAQVPGDPFEAQALVLLEHQLDNVNALGRYYQDLQVDISVLEDSLDRVTSLYDLSTLDETTRLQRLQDKLPAWLNQASPLDSAHYAALLSRLAQVQRASGGHSYLDGIDDLHTYANKALVRQIRLDHPREPVALDDIEVRLYQAPNALLQVADAGDAHLEYAVISLEALALFNLHGRPPGMLEVEARHGAKLPGWVTKEAVAELIRTVDVGGNYLALLRRLLLDDPQQAARRETLYTDQLRLQLPLKLLELKIRQEQGVTAEGVRMFFRALKVNPVARRGRRTPVAARPALRQLGIRRAPGAKPDPVLCTYVVGPGDDAEGIRVLYRPLSRVPLRQFAGLHELLEAIRVPGALHDEIIEGLAVAARPVYANGGFEEPHIRHFLQGDEATPLTPPPPATLATIELQGELWGSLYRSNVEGLQAIAERQSTSDDRDRWIGYRELGWLTFNALLPMLGGPLATAGWMIQSLKSFDEGFQGQLKGDPQAANNALVEFFFNTAFLLLSHGMEAQSTGVARLRKPSAGELEGVGSAPSRPLPVLVPGGAVAASLKVTPQTMPTLHRLEFGWQSARQRLSVTQQQALASFAIEAPANIGQPVPHGALRGLYLAAEQWYALLDSQYYAVAVGSDAVQIIDTADLGRTGPWLRRDEAARWRVDTRMRLVGGAPGKALEKFRAARAARIEALVATVDNFRQRQEIIDRKLKLTQQVMSDLQKQGSKRYPEYRQRFIELAAEMVTTSGQAVDAVAELNAVEVSPHFFEKRAGHLRSLLRVTWEIVSKQREQLLELVLGDGLGRGAAKAEPMGSFDEIASGCELIEQLIRWTGEAQKRMADLAQIQPFGPPMLADIKPVWAPFGTPLTWRGVQLYWLAILSEQKVSKIPNLEGTLADVAISAKLAAYSHEETLEPGAFTDAEQIEVLDSALDRYDELEDAVDFIKATTAASLHSPALERLLLRVGELRASAEERLGPLFHAQLVRSRQLRKQHKPVRQQVIVTSKRRGVVVGKPRGGSGDALQRVDVAGGLGEAGLESFRRVQGGDDWERVEPVRPTAPAVSLAPLELLMREAVKMLGDSQGQLRVERLRAPKVRVPADVQTTLDAIAERLNAKAGEIDQALTRLNQVDLPSSSTGQSADVLANDLRARAALLEAQGRRLRIELCKARDPQSSRVEWLVAQGAVTIEPVSVRKPLKGGGDFLQEYAIKDGGQVLWYAHFHYRTLAAPAEQFTAAHLKTVAQRFLTYQQFVALADSREGMRKHVKVGISPNMAKKLYLGLGVKAG